MKVKLLVIVAAILMSAAMAFAQPATITFWGGYNPDFSFNDESIMRLGCTQDSPALPAGLLIRIFWDQNGNGQADASDPVWPADNANYIDDWTNDAEGPGTYTQLGPVLIVPQPPAAPANGMFLKIYCGADDASLVHYVSPVMPLSNGLATDWFFPRSVWTCTECGTPPYECHPAADVTLVPNDTNFPAPQNVSACVEIGATPTTIMVPVANASNVPQAHYELGCANNPDCPPAEAVVYDDNAWVYSADPTPHFTNYISNSGLGCCVTLFLDYVLPVGMTSFTAVPRDNAVELAWNVASETNLLNYTIVRNGAPLTTVRAEGKTTYNFVDNSAKNGTTYNYSVVAHNIDGTIAAEKTVEGVTPAARLAVVTEYALHQNYPNPFNPSTSIRFDLVDANFVTLKVFNANGQEVANLINGQMPKGVNMVNFDATNLTSGLYFYTIKAGNVYSATKKMLLVK